MKFFISASCMLFWNDFFMHGLLVPKSLKLSVTKLEAILLYSQNIVAKVYSAATFLNLSTSLYPPLPPSQNMFYTSYSHPYLSAPPLSISATPSISSTPHIYPPHHPHLPPSTHIALSQLHLYHSRQRRSNYSFNKSWTGLESSTSP